MAQPSSSAPGQGDDSSQGGAPSQGAQPPSQGQSSDSSAGGPITQLLGNVGGALQHLEQVFSASKAVAPQDQQLISQIVQMYGQLMQSLQSPQGQGQDQSGQPGGAQGQTSPMEAAGNKGAQPVM